ncbi:hypothetical protein TcCL_NonESM00365 [Trypanosoma cruzi]|nr:hypothetical protein TcCL_NonESM00365 [Trypanosoma cruzi]
MHLPGVPRGPSGHWDCVECGILRGYLAVLFLFLHPPIPNLNTAAEPTTATGSFAYFRISLAFQRQAWCVLLGRHGGRKWAALSGKRWSRRSVLRTSQFGVFVASLADGVTAPLLLAGREAMLHGGAHFACGGFYCCWFVNVYFLLEHHRGRCLRTAEHCEEGHRTIFGAMRRLL